MASWRMIEYLICIILAGSNCACSSETNLPKVECVDLSAIESPIVIKGDARCAFRDPAAIYYEGVFYLYFTFVEIEGDGRIYSYTAMSKSRDLVEWTEKRIITPKGQRLNYCSPGNVISIYPRSN